MEEDPEEVKNLEKVQTDNHEVKPTNAIVPGPIAPDAEAEILKKSKDRPGHPSNSKPKSSESQRPPPIVITY